VLKTSTPPSSLRVPESMAEYGALLDDDAVVVLKGGWICGTTVSNWCVWRSSAPSWWSTD